MDKNTLIEMHGKEALFGDACNDMLFGASTNDADFYHKAEQQKQHMHNTKNITRENHAAVNRMNIGLRSRLNDVVPINANKLANLCRNVSNDNDWRVVA